MVRQWMYVGFMDYPATEALADNSVTVILCGLEPSLWATATLMALSDSLSPTAVIGGACSQSPECGEAAARSLALFT